MTLAENHRPDSALSLLQTLNRSRFSEAEAAHYALVYTLAQDKSGVDVSNDSLLRLAYNHYRTLPTDSLYSRCMYYMGKYYLLTDSAHAAAHCLHEAERAAAADCDTAVQCMALDKLGKIYRMFEPKKALQCAIQASTLYKKYSKANTFNIIYYTLAKAEYYSSNGQPSKALADAQSALSMSMELNDSMVISDANQTLSNIYLALNKNQQALDYAIQSVNYANTFQSSKYLNLSDCYKYNGQYTACISLLDSVQFKTESNKFLADYTRLECYAVLHKNPDMFIVADSAIQHLSKMYSDAFEEKDQYYTEMMTKTKQLTYEEGRSFLYRVISIPIFILILSLFALGITLFRKKVQKQKMEIEAMNAKMHYQDMLQLKEKEHYERLHDEQLKHKEKEIQSLRSYILRKIELLTKINATNETDKTCIKLSDEDWNDLNECLQNTDAHFIETLHREYPSLNEKDMHFLMLLRLRLTNKSLALIYGISEKSIKQKLFVFKAKLGIEGENFSLREFIENF